ncbi:MAG: zinc ribbon domain-containing protein [Dehalococcoidia bacterium]|nr:zinc ribbon domain-containing protein [Dehalococcoidia bacterium]
MIKAIAIPGLPVSLISLISLVIGIIAIVIIVRFRQDFVPRLNADYPNFPQAGILVSETITLLIILIAYMSFENSLRLLMRQWAWLCPVIFLTVSLWPLYRLITTLYHSSGPIADWATTKLAPSPTESLGEIKCPSCGKFNPALARFCTSCGASIATSTYGIKCAECGTANRQHDKYCLNCGALIDTDDQYDTRVSVY